MVEEGIRGGMCHAIHRHAKANNKYMKNYDEKKESSFLEYLDANNLYGWAMEQNLPVRGFKWVKGLSRIDEDLIKIYDKNSNIGYFLKVDIKYPKELHDLYSDLSFLLERMKINKCSKLVCNLYDKKNYVVYIRTLKQALMYGLKLKKVHKVLQFDQKSWLRTYIEMNTELRKKAKNDFEKEFFKLMNNSVFGKPMENVRKHRDIKLVTTVIRRNKLVSEPNYHSIKCFSENLVATEMRKTKIKMSKPIYVGMTIFDISKTLIYEFWYGYLKPKYGDKMKLYYMDTDSLIPIIKTEDFYEDIANDVEKRFDTSNYEVDRPLPMGKNKKVIDLMKDELGGKIMTEFVALRPKTYAYAIDVDKDKEVRKAKGTKRCLIKEKLKFEEYKYCLLNTKAVLKSQQRFKSERHDLYTEEVNKIALSRNDDKRL